MSFHHSCNLLKNQEIGSYKRSIRPVFIFLLIASLLCSLIIIVKGVCFFREADSSPSYAQWGQENLSAASDPNTYEEVSAISEINPAPSASKFNLTGKIGEGGSIYKSLQTAGISDEDIHLIVSNLGRLFSFRSKAQPEDSYRLRLNDEGKVERFEYQKSPLAIYCMQRDKRDNWDSWQQNVKLKKYWERLDGEIKGSLFSTFKDKGYPVSLAVQFAEVFEWKIDFQHQVRDGDRFNLVVERFFKDEKPMGYGKILAVIYKGIETGTLKGFYCEQGDGHGDYYTPDGISLRQAFLRAPLSYRYISSGFTYHRRHPILGFVRPHLGIDFAAPSGSPVWSVADGIVLSKTRDPYNGNQIKVKHMSNYITFYNHLSGFPKGIKAGNRVSQKQIIGYVGTTGLSTGPHLDYRVKKGNMFINPLTAQFPCGQPLKKSYTSAFNKIVASLESALNGNNSSQRVLIAEVESSQVNFTAL